MGFGLQLEEFFAKLAQVGREGGFGRRSRWEGLREEVVVCLRCLRDGSFGRVIAAAEARCGEGALLCAIHGSSARSAYEWLSDNVLPSKRGRASGVL